MTRKRRQVELPPTYVGGTPIGSNLLPPGYSGPLFSADQYHPGSTIIEHFRYVINSESRILETVNGHASALFTKRWDMRLKPSSKKSLWSSRR